jgi:hypothetical protein
MDFYGVDNHSFRVGRGIDVRTFEAMEDEDDGYRSFMGAVERRADGVFFARPVSKVSLRKEANRYYRDYPMYELVDETGHVWLRFGTDTTDEYYPFFVFDYSPLK